MNQPTLQKFLRVIAWILGVLLFLVLAIFTRVDRRPLHEMEYYHQTMAALDSASAIHSYGEAWLAGWSKVNMTPPEPVNLVGYKPRGPYTFVQDSSYVRALSIGNGENTVTLLSYELMIIHPTLYEKITNAVKSKGLPTDMLYFTATHTHSGMGGYMPGLAGQLAFGGYDQNVMELMEKKTIEAIERSLAQKDTVQLSYSAIETSGLVANRLVEGDPVDPYLRQMILERNTGEKAVFLSFAAHSTILHSKYMGLSGDYPNYLMKELESSGFDFAFFAAGAVGSHKPLAGGNTLENVQSFSGQLKEQMTQEIHVAEFEVKPKISFYSFPLFLRKPHYRIGENVRLRPYIFNALFGNTNAHFDVLQLGDVLLISSSGEVSGVFMKEWEEYANSYGLQVILTCFNGGYIGYITPDKYYDIGHYEVKDMNWFGPYNGAFFDEIMKVIIKKASE